MLLCDPVRHLRVVDPDSMHCEKLAGAPVEPGHGSLEVGPRGGERIAGSREVGLHLEDVLRGREPELPPVGMSLDDEIASEFARQMVDDDDDDEEPVVRSKPAADSEEE